MRFSCMVVVCAAIGFTASVSHAASPKKSGNDNTTLSGGVASDLQWDLEIPRQELESILIRLVQAYEAGSIDQFMTLFAAQVRTEAGLLPAKALREEYVEIFLGSLRRRLILRNIHWERTNNDVIADADFTTHVTSRRDERMRERRGAARFHLTKSTAAWAISELYFSYDN